MEAQPSFLKGVHLHCNTNNSKHYTIDITEKRLIVRRGQPFLMTIKLNEGFNPDVNPLTITAQTGKYPKEDLGTKSCFSIPENLPTSRSAKAVWKADLMQNSSIKRGNLTLIVTPPADCPIGEYKLLIKYKEKEVPLAEMVVLFNPWCPNDSVYMLSENKKKEYVLNESGVVYTGSANYIGSRDWDFGQFEEDMVDICMQILDKSLSYQEDPELDVSSRNDPIHVGRVLSAMINSEDDPGILQGNWSGYYMDGESPTHWNGSHEILKRWYKNDCSPVKYGQCWVFACVMCSVMRLLGIPCRVITNFSSAHDTDRNLTIDTYHCEDGVEERQSPDSVWNFHVWVEGWFRRPDLDKFGKYDGWQVLDPTPQETSEGVYRCGPASVKAIKEGRTDFKYDVPFVFAEVNADCVDWQVKLKDGQPELKQVVSDAKRVGRNISTKSVISQERREVTRNYKHKEGTAKERMVFVEAVTRDYSKVDHVEDEEEENTGSEDDSDHEDGETTTEDEKLPPKLNIRFEEVTQPINGKDVSLNLVLHSEGDVGREFNINITVQAMRYNGVPVANIQREESTQKLLPWKDLTIPVLVTYADYHKEMIECDSMKIEAMVSEIDMPENIYLASSNVVLLDPEIYLNVPDEGRCGLKVKAEMIFENPVEEKLTKCKLTVTGSGLLDDDVELKLPDLDPNNRVRVALYFTPKKRGLKTLLVDFDCSEFRDIKTSSTIYIF